MRKPLLVPVFASMWLAGCAGQAGTGTNVGEEDAPLSSYESVFHGAPDNDTLPVIDFKADAIAAKNTELLQWQSPVRNQARRGVCTIFSTIGLMEHLMHSTDIQTGLHGTRVTLEWRVPVETSAEPEYAPATP